MAVSVRTWSTDTAAHALQDTPEMTVKLVSYSEMYSCLLNVIMCLTFDTCPHAVHTWVRKLVHIIVYTGHITQSFIISVGWRT